MGSDQSGAVLLERDGALSTLDAAFGAVVAGRGQLALVSGEAGIGKSSLVRALRGLLSANGAPTGGPLR
jgi:predicted ATPase